MIDTDFEFLLRNYNKYIDIAAKQNKKVNDRRIKIKKVLSILEKPTSQS